MSKYSKIGKVNNLPVRLEKQKKKKKKRKGKKRKEKKRKEKVKPWSNPFNKRTREQENKRTREQENKRTREQELAEILKVQMASIRFTAINAKRKVRKESTHLTEVMRLSPLCLNN